MSDGFDIAAVYTKIRYAEKPRHEARPRRAVKEYAQYVACRCLQPQSFRDEETVQQLRELKPDLHGRASPTEKFCRRAVLDIPQMRLRSICTAASCRSFAAPRPVQRSILNHCG